MTKYLNIRHSILDNLEELLLTLSEKKYFSRGTERNGFHDSDIDSIIRIVDSSVRPKESLYIPFRKFDKNGVNILIEEPSKTFEQTYIDPTQVGFVRGNDTIVGMRFERQKNNRLVVHPTLSVVAENVHPNIKRTKVVYIINSAYTDTGNLCIKPRRLLDDHPSQISFYYDDDQFNSDKEVIQYGKINLKNVENLSKASWVIVKRSF